MAKVTIYSTTYCPYCTLEKAYLTSQDIDFNDVLIDRKPEEIQTLVDTCGSMGVPCTHIVKDDGTEERILGFDKPMLDAALGIV